ncbi:TPA: DNA adenine methylase [Escherichia coli]|nr:DNA adenine methylase [Escherichia coli]HEI0663027.1 DNA adenine methylase [Escherichia coli]
MKYMGSKSRFKFDILNKIPTTDSVYIEPFAGGMNMMDGVRDARYRLANDSNKYVIEMFKALTLGWVPEKLNKQQYLKLKSLNGPDYLIGWAGIACSYSGKWFGGFADVIETKNGTIRDYQSESIRNAVKQAKNLHEVVFTSLRYDELAIPEGSVVYCDPPYAGTTGYKDGFDNDKFWEWARQISKSSDVFVSEYTAPSDFKCILEIHTKSSLSANGVSGGSKSSSEKLFKLRK